MRPRMPLYAPEHLKRLLEVRAGAPAPRRTGRKNRHEASDASSTSAFLEGLHSGGWMTARAMAPGRDDEYVEMAGGKIPLV